LHRAPWLIATSLPHSRKSSLRIKQLYAQAALASLVLWLVGIHGRLLDWVRRLQANTEAVDLCCPRSLSDASL
jgi:hypothetical protein